MNSLHLKRLLKDAVQNHQRGNLTQAEKLYRQILQEDPLQADALHLLGVIAAQMTQYVDAIALIQQAISLNSTSAVYYENLGHAFREHGDANNAIFNYQKAIRLDPTLTPSILALDSLLQQQERWVDIESLYRYLLPHWPDVHYNFGVFLFKQGRYDESLEQYQKMLALRSNHADTWFNMGAIFSKMNRYNDALNHYFQALLLSPDNLNFKNRFIQVLAAMNIQKFPQETIMIPEFLTQLQSCFETGVAQMIVGGIVTQILKRHPQCINALKMVQQNPNDTELFSQEAVIAFTKNKLFLALLSKQMITDSEFEHFLLAFRRYCLLNVLENSTKEPVDLSFICALASQCFINEYIYVVSEMEQHQLQGFKQKLEQILNQSSLLTEDISKFVIYSMYAPLYTLEGVFQWKELFQPPFSQIWKQQVLDYQTERKIKKQIPVLTPIEDITSLQVKAQYEEHPYPRWTNFAQQTKISLDHYFKEAIPNFTLPQFPHQPLKIMVAGCGTGQEVINTALKFQDLEITALDMSSSSLAYAKRMSQEAGLNNIPFKQADILQLATFKETFELIFCTGVLHHLKHPLNGWQILVNLLAPNGLMKVGFYSTKARRYIWQIREILKTRDMLATSENIRKFRDEVYCMEDQDLKENIISFGDFYSLSTCRDLLFHVQEHTFDLIEIEAMLAQLGLRFLGFIHPHGELFQKRFYQYFSPQADLADLKLWNQFEERYPDTFKNMYQFWCQKIS